MKTCPIINFAGFVFIAIVISCFSCCVVYEGVVDNNISANITGFINNSTASSYFLDISPVDDLQNWTRVTSYSSVNSTNESSILAHLNTSRIANGRYGLRITAIGVNNTNSSDLVYLTIENSHYRGTCPTWSCDDLTEGNNYVDVGLNEEEYFNNMDCSVECACPSGLYGFVYTNGSLESDYDYVNLTEEPANDAYYYGVWELTDNWSIYDDWVTGLYTSANGSRINITFHSDYSKNGSDGYEGFQVSNLICSRYRLIKAAYVYSSYPEPYFSRITINSSNGTSNGRSYEDHSDSVLASLVTGKTYNISLNISNRNTNSGTVNLTAWVDYNQDYLFNSTTEKINLGQINVSDTGSILVRKNFSVPYDAKTGETRLRVKVYASVDVIPEVNLSYSESINGVLDDYTVDIVQGPCQINGDNPPCSRITLREVVDLINHWVDNEASLSEVVRLITAWASR